MLRPEATPLALRLQAGPSLLMHTSDEDYADYAELFLSYGAQGIYELGRVELIGGVSGRGILTESGDFNERTFHHLGFAANIDLGIVRPGVIFRPPPIRGRPPEGGRPHVQKGKPALSRPGPAGSRSRRGDPEASTWSGSDAAERGVWLHPSACGEPDGYLLFG